VAVPASEANTEPPVDSGRARRTVGALIGALGALGVAASAYLDWFAGQMPTEIPLQRLFDTEVTGTAGAYWTSMAAPLALVGVIGVLGGVWRSRLVITLAGLLGLATLVLWVLMQAADLSPEDLRASDYEAGLWVCVASLAVVAAGVLMMGSPRRRKRSDPNEPSPEEKSADAETPTRPSEV
jgi:hypothetical protein